MAAKTGLCRYCEQSKPLVRAHIIPAAFFRAIGGGKGGTPLLFTNNANQPFTKRSPTGVYDSEILCDACERKFDHLDAYGTKTLLHTLRGKNLKALSHGNDVYGFEAKGIDQALLLRFFVGTLWRAAVSRQDFFSRVQLLARHEKLARKAIGTEDVSPDFGVTLAAFKSADGRDESVGIMDPLKQRYGGVNVYRFYFGAFHAHIKVDQRPFAEPQFHMALGQHDVLGIVRRDYASSKDGRAMLQTAREQHRNELMARQQSREVPRAPRD